ncbi:MAG: response regulator [Bacteroidota bacterium]
MSNIKILIVEDEMIIAAKISLHLEQLGYEVAGIIPRGEEAVVHCRENAPDILLLDINLKGLIDGVETAKVLQREMEIPIIYLTANADESTFNRAKSTRPYAFISKPYKKLDLQRTIELTVSRMAENKGITITNEQEQEDSYILSDRIFVRSNNKMVKLFLKDILYVEAERSYCRIYSKENEYLLSIPLKDLYEKLQPDHFMRVHRSFVINLKQVDEVAEGHVVISRKVVPLGKSYREEFLQRIQLI